MTKREKNYSKIICRRTCWSGGKNSSPDTPSPTSGRNRTRGTHGRGDSIQPVSLPSSSVKVYPRHLIRVAIVNFAVQRGLGGTFWRRGSGWAGWNAGTAVGSGGLVGVIILDGLVLLTTFDTIPIGAGQQITGHVVFRPVWGDGRVRVVQEIGDHGDIARGALRFSVQCILNWPPINQSINRTIQDQTDSKFKFRLQHNKPYKPSYLTI